MKFEFYAPILLLVVGIIWMLGQGFFFLYRTRRIINNYHRAEGKVMALEARESDTAGSYSPFVRFTARDGREIEFLESRASTNPDFQVGQQVTVLYNPKNFNQARLLTSKWEMYYSAILLLGLGTVFLLSGVLMAVVFGALYFSGAMEKD